MPEILSNILIAVITAAVPILTGFGITALTKLTSHLSAKTQNVKIQRYIAEISSAVSDAVAATSQTYVDALKAGGKFSADCQKEAAKKALKACVDSITPAAYDFVRAMYGDTEKYLLEKIEAEVHNQKFE